MTHSGPRSFGVIVSIRITSAATRTARTTKVRTAKQASDRTKLPDVAVPIN